MVDLGRWLNNEYRMAGEKVEVSEDLESIHQDES
jgi:endogenous inhibitor of DNA gyrase (YacG/DUF329 family)